MVHVQEDEHGTRRDGLAKLNHVIFILGADEVWFEVYVVSIPILAHKL